MDACWQVYVYRSVPLYAGAGLCEHSLVYHGNHGADHDLRSVIVARCGDGLAFSETVWGESCLMALSGF